MRISDWSSDVCSSDLLLHPRSDSLSQFPWRADLGTLSRETATRQKRMADEDRPHRPFRAHRPRRRGDLRLLQPGPRHGGRALRRGPHRAHLRPAEDQPAPGGRSEEHTSELQSLMRISYAVFCFKKKTTQI